MPEIVRGIMFGLIQGIPGQIIRVVGEQAGSIWTKE